MELQIIALYFFTDNFLKSIHFYDDPQTLTSTAEIVTSVLTAAQFFSGNHPKAAAFLKEHNYIPKFLSESRFNRRLHLLPPDLWEQLFHILAQHFKENNFTNEYIVDSFPVSVCDNIRIFRSKILSEEKYRGYIANKKRFFYGIRVHMIITRNLEPVAFVFAPGSDSDISIFKNLPLETMPPKSTIYADKAHNDYEEEDFLKEHDIYLIPARRKHSSRPLDGVLNYLQKTIRKAIETIFSVIVNLFPKSIHAVTSNGFTLKIFCFILAYSWKKFVTSLVN